MAIHQIKLNTTTLNCIGLALNRSQMSLIYNYCLNTEDRLELWQWVVFRSRYILFDQSILRQMSDVLVVLGITPELEYNKEFFAQMEKQGMRLEPPNAEELNTTEPPAF